MICPNCQTQTNQLNDELWTCPKCFTSFSPMSDFLPITDNQVEQINNCCEIVNDWATKKGWNEGEDSVQRKCSDIALIHSELSECLEFIRKKPVFTCPLCKDVVEGSLEAIPPYCECGGVYDINIFDDHVPSLTGESAELADVLIRIFHYAGKRNINLGRAVQLKHDYNTRRPYKHGKVI